jgi:hypothetical protein
MPSYEPEFSIPGTPDALAATPPQQVVEALGAYLDELAAWDGRYDRDQVMLQGRLLARSGHAGIDDRVLDWVERGRARSRLGPAAWILFGMWARQTSPSVSLATLERLWRNRGDLTEDDDEGSIVALSEGLLAVPPGPGRDHLRALVLDEVEGGRRSEVSRNALREEVESLRKLE